MTRELDNNPQSSRPNGRTNDCDARLEVRNQGSKNGRMIEATTRKLLQCGAITVTTIGTDWNEGAN